MKKVLAAIMAGVLLLSVFGCSCGKSKEEKAAEALIEGLAELGQ